MEKVESYTPLVARVLLAGVFILSGLNKIGSYSGVQGYMVAFGVPGFLLAPTIAFEVIAGLALIAGWQVRISAVLLAGFSVLSALIFHADFADSNQFSHLLKNFSIAGGMLMLALHGAGPVSLDARRLGREVTA
ncbi:MAG: DoxX family protein [Henriciella sp.]|nr:DoxX family protein [Henriciella sp.]